MNSKQKLYGLFDYLLFGFDCFFSLWILFEWKWKHIIKFFKAIFVNKREERKSDIELSKELEEKMEKKQPKQKKKTDWFPLFGKK